MKTTDFLFSVCYHAYEKMDQVKMTWKKSCKGQKEECSVNLMEEGQDMWSCSISLAGDEAIENFHFEVWRGDEMIDTEPHFCHYVPSSASLANRVACSWISNRDDNNYRYSSAFRECIYPCQASCSVEKNSSYLMVQDFLCPQDMQLYVAGNTEELGNWNPQKAVLTQRVDNYVHLVPLAATADSVEYKFLLKNSSTGETIWESGDNRYLRGVGQKPAMTTFLEVAALQLPQQKEKLAGMVVPVFSLRSRQSWGVGDFGDLKRMIGWAHQTGLHLLQTLPINDTTRTGSWVDSYPYNSISIFALHPMYADLNALGKLKDAKLQKEMEKERKALNELSLVDYEKVNDLKNRYLHCYFDEHQTEIKVTPCELLKPYCYFRVLQEEYGTADFRQWPEFQQYDEKALSAWIKKGGRAKKYKYYAWVQSLLVSQLKTVHDYARENGVILKGDMPIGVSRDSATAWFYPRYFHFDGQAGAPPDFFSATGQNWGFPTYDWDNILKDGGIWWKQRLEFMAQFYDAYRIDHVLGFFRIWQIPYGTSDGRLGYFLPDLPMTEDEIRQNGFWKSMAEASSPQKGEEDWDVLFVKDQQNPSLYHPAVSGQSTRQYKELTDDERAAYDRIYFDYFYKRHNDFWAKEGMRRLPCAVYSTSMLVCAEDLGMIPDCVHGILERFRILSLEVQNMPKRTEEGEFSWLPNNPFRSVDTVTTHDMEPLRLWWKNNRETAQHYYEQRMGGWGTAPEELAPEMAENILRQHLQCPSLLCIIGLQDWLAMDGKLRNPIVEQELINNPANPCHYWRYRMHLYIEDMMQATDFNERVRWMAKRTF